MDRFDRQFWRRLSKLAKPYWTSDQKWSALGMLATIIVLGLISVGVGAIFTYISRDLLNALQVKDKPAVWAQLWKFLAASVFFIPLSAYFPWLIGRLTIMWREWMTQRFLARSFADRAFYAINAAGNVDNPDQRISEDIGSFAGATLGFLLTLLNAPISGITYFVILWTISPKLAVFLLFYAAAGSYASVLVGRRLVSINFDQQRYEADFRFGLVHVRDNAEPIAMYGGEAYEERQLLGRFARLVKNFNLLIRWRRNLAFVTSTYNDPVSLLPWFLLAGAYFAGKVELGQLSQAAAAFGTLKGAVSIVIDQFNSIANYACVVNRLAEFDEHCESAALHAADETEIKSEHDDSRLALDKLTLATPDHQRTLIRDLSLTTGGNERVLIQGDSGAGKTSLLRAIAGLWKSGSGTVVRPSLDRIMFLPQRPYMVLGTLRDQLRYPNALDATDEQLVHALADVNLANLPERAGGLDAERNWADFLSPGEQQRLAFARLLVHRPPFAFLDEATSALDAKNEEKLYARLAQLHIAAVSVGHRASLRKFHDRVLNLEPDSTWEISDGESVPPPDEPGSATVA
jgi:putative ATP-binding cassette transporter